MSELTAALIQFHKDVGVIKKDAKAQYGKFADLCGVLSTITPALLKNNLVLTQEFLEDSLVTTLRHVSGETISSTSRLVITPGRNELHSWGASVTYTRRYQICSLLSIVADMDMDGAMEEDTQQQQQTKPAPKKTVTKKKRAEPKPVVVVREDADKTVTQVAEKFAEALGADLVGGQEAKPTDPLKREQVDQVLEKLKAKRNASVSKFEQIQKAFFAEFKIGSDCRFSESITTHAHLSFLNERI